MAALEKARPATRLTGRTTEEGGSSLPVLSAVSRNVRRRKVRPFQSDASLFVVLLLCTGCPRRLEEDEADVPTATEANNRIRRRN
eukprot:CAMPEP_0198148348 /NCGR_PEP_ID=MMETSP1443-20131203/40925_1 /TAXON_ID=186043 /ORGANISM="Entomoneis sp., Strain CCMP2396" /LENGTH=84 /DNA_ID=CAMNT_0043813009 /DNA_START=327 /DNA_END=578 /DNA_ORIENTATION=-